MPKAKSHAQKIAEREVAAARRSVGDGWLHISPLLRRGLVMANIIGVIRGQDESIPKKDVLEYLDELVVAADDILDEDFTGFR